MIKLEHSIGGRAGFSLLQCVFPINKSVKESKTGTHMSLMGLVGCISVGESLLRSNEKRRLAVRPAGE